MLAIGKTLVMFDKLKVMNLMSKATYQALLKAASYVWTRERTSMKQRAHGKYAPPGTAPFTHGWTDRQGKSHSGNLKAKALNRFAYDLSTGSAVIGPMPFAKGEAPRKLEAGGDETVTWGHKGKSRTIHIRPHPYMGPALEKELEAGSIPAAWANSLKVG